jgi:hypothetical protein
VPDKPGRMALLEAGLGEKRISMIKNKDPEYLRNILYESYDKLKDGGGFELLRTAPTTRLLLEKILMPASGYSSNYLSDESGLGGAICYIRPVQSNLSLDPVQQVEVIKVVV